MTKPLAAWLYGSHARGDADSLSDLDIFAVCDTSVDPAMLPMLLAQTQERPAAVSRYSWLEFKKMVEQGSLFLEHIKSEGIPLYEDPQSSGKVRQALGRLAPYERGERDVKAFRTVLSDVREELAAGSPPDYEFAVLGTVVRHAAILGCYLVGKPCFGRTEPVFRFARAAGLPQKTADEFPRLYQHRLALEGRMDRLPSEEVNAGEWLSWAERIVDRVGEACHAAR